MKFTKASSGKRDQKVVVTFNARNGYWIDVAFSQEFPKDDEIRKALKQANYCIEQSRGYSYKITGGTGEDLHKLTQELEIEYGLIDPVEDVALLSKIAIEVAIAASKTNGSRLNHDDFHAGFNAIDAAKNDEFMNVCLETARAIVGLIN